ncbi:MAG: DUF1571 domain-containing protein [Bacteroidales bacterium]|nr:DUF1571 domain-containing protein [Bacteroidales bacterium]
MSLHTTARSVLWTAAIAGGVLCGPRASGQVVAPVVVPSPGTTPLAVPSPKTIPLVDTPPIALPTPMSKVTPSRPPVSDSALPQMLADTRAAYAKVRDYVCHYVRQESVSGRLVPEQKCILRVRVKPFSVAVLVESPKEYAHRETTFISGRNRDKVWFREANSLKVQSLDPLDPRVMLDTRHRITDTGIHAVLNRFERSVQIERRLNNPIQVLVSEYNLVGRPCTRYELFCDRPHVLRYAARQVLYVDHETKLPVRYEAYTQATPGGTPGGELIESQSFLGLKINQGISSAAFER